MTAQAEQDVRVEHVAWDDADADALRAAQQAELRERYDDDDIGHTMTGDGIVAMLLLRVDGRAVACGALRDVSDEHGPGTGELKRMYVRPDARGRGLSRQVLTALEDAAAEHALDRLVLETGVLQPEAIGLYLAAGYHPVENYGEYVGVVESRCFAKLLRPASSPATPAAGERAIQPRTHAGPTPAADAVERVTWDHPDAVALRRAMVDELAPLYPEHAFGESDGFEHLDAEQGTSAVTTFLVRHDGIPVACVTHRRASAGWGAGVAELKRLYVAPAARGLGTARRLVGLVEDDARAQGAARVVLDTGIRQPEAIALYRRLGYRPVTPPAGSWEALPVSLWFARDV
ncbi:GNAT family N-acetyltransferase [Cellulomonas sp. S1-8]|uniref:GNAT family N-acetyltransferase n=1 Tax=Cellulomonas sp. S1-8 TaxID=2904790 RepID=UPI0022433967|nr:GNAT family N-acetyltransferase [Cellulomonas sp. S1-8]UZN02645.1 GNAT family N-acetyltransferase [Cellulomonas sp. S1-8]